MPTPVLVRSLGWIVALAFSQNAASASIDLSSPLFTALCERAFEADELASPEEIVLQTYVSLLAEAQSQGVQPTQLKTLLEPGQLFQFPESADSNLDAVRSGLAMLEELPRSTAERS